MGVRSSSTGIEMVPVLKDALLQRLRENREKHEAEFKKAFTGYQKAWLKAAAKARDDVEKRHAKVLRQIDRAVSAAEKAVAAGKMLRLPRYMPDVGKDFPVAPTCHSGDYEMAIDLFDAFQPFDPERPGVIDLSVSDFAHYFRDDWTWKSDHRESISNYAGAPGPTGSPGPIGPIGTHGPKVYDLDLTLDED